MLECQVIQDVLREILYFAKEMIAAKEMVQVK